MDSQLRMTVGSMGEVITDEESNINLMCQECYTSYLCNISQLVVMCNSGVIPCMVCGGQIDCSDYEFLMLENG